MSAPILTMEVCQNFFINQSQLQFFILGSDVLNEAISDIVYCMFSGCLYRWTTPCVLLLLDTYKANEQKFTNGKQFQKKTWEEVSETLKRNGHNVTGPMCAAKLRSLKKTYKTIKDHNNKSGNDRRTWQFFEVWKYKGELVSVLFQHLDHSNTHYILFCRSWTKFSRRKHGVPLWLSHLPQACIKSRMKKGAVWDLTVGVQLVSSSFCNVWISLKLIFIFSSSCIYVIVFI